MADQDPNLISQEEAAAQLLGQETTPKPEESSQPEASPNFAERAAAAEAELAAENGQVEPAPKAEEKPLEAKPEAKPVSSGSKLKDLIDKKYGGDENKFFDGLVEQWNSASKLASELSELRTSLKQASEPAPVAADEPPDETLTQLDQAISGIDHQITSFRQEQDRLVAEGQNLRAEILELRGEAKRADEMDKAVLERKIDRLEAQLERKASRWEARDEKIRDLEAKKLDFNLNKVQAQTRLDQVKANQKQQEQDLRVYREQTRQQFDEAIADAATGFGISKDSKVFQHFYNAIKAETVYYLRTDESGEPLDIKAFVKQRSDIYADVMKLSKQTELSNVTQEKLQAGAKPVVKPANPTAQTPAPQVREKAWTAEFAKKRAARVLGG